MKKIYFSILCLNLIAIGTNGLSAVTVKPEFANDKLTSMAEIKKYLNLPFDTDDLAPQKHYELLQLNDIKRCFGEAHVEKIVTAAKDSLAFFITLINKNKFEITIMVVENKNNGCNKILEYLLFKYSTWSQIVDDFKVTENNAEKYQLDNIKLKETIIFDLKKLLIINIKAMDPNIKNDHYRADVNYLYSKITNITQTPINHDFKEALNQKNPEPQENSLNSFSFSVKSSLPEDFYIDRLKKYLDINNKSAFDYFSIAEMYFHGRRGIPVDKNKARENYQFAFDKAMVELRLDKNNHKAYYIAGMCAEKILSNAVNSIEYLTISANGNYPQAEAELAFRYMKGYGVNADFDKAYQYAEKASEHDNMLGRAILGAYYLMVRKDTEKGVALLKESAEAGNAGGQYMLFYYLYYTKGLEDNKKLALQLLQLSADQGLPDAVSKWTNINKRK